VSGRERINGLKSFGLRLLLRQGIDLFEVAIRLFTGTAAIIYIDDTLTTDSLGNPLPQVVLAQQN
jgi:hypothetical protein